MRNMTIDGVREFIKDKKKLPNMDLWPEPMLDKNTQKFNGDITRCVQDIPMVEFARQVGKQFQFPPSSSLLLMLGVLGSITARAINTRPFNNDSERPLNSYVVVGAASSSGKTPTMKYFRRNISTMARMIERDKQKKRMMIEMKISDAHTELKMIKKANPDSNPNDIPAYKQVKEDLTELYDQLEEQTETVWNMAEFNLQVLASTARKQFGYIPVVSDENESLLFLTGAKAGIETSIMRKAFDGDPFTYGKQDDGKKSGIIELEEPVAGVCIAGQENILDLLIRESLKESEESNGFIERFWAIIEQGSAGYKAEMEVGGPPDPELCGKWKQIIRNVINIKIDMDRETGMVNRKVLDFDKNGKELIFEHYLKYDRLRRPGEVFCEQPITGFVGKSSAHISNIAGLLHIMKEWNIDGRTNDLSYMVSYETIEQATKLFAQLTGAMKTMLEAKGVIGGHVRSNKVQDGISSLVTKKRKRMFTNSEIQQSIGGLNFFRKGTQLKSAELFDSIYPALEQKGVICVVGKKVYVNPNFS